MTGKLIDVTFLELTDAVFDVVAAVRSGAPVVDVEHLTADERHAACKLLGVSGAAWDAFDALKAPPAPPTVEPGVDFEAAILADADDRYPLD